MLADRGAAAGEQEVGALRAVDEIGEGGFLVAGDAEIDRLSTALRDERGEGEAVGGDDLAGRQGFAGLLIPSQCPRTHSPSHTGLFPLWAAAESAGVPILFHVGGEEKMAKAYLENGLPYVKDFHGGDENFTSLTFMAIPLSVWQTLSALVIDGVFDRFPRLKFGAIELGASWLPSLMKFLDSGCAAFGREERLQKLSDTPSAILRRQLRVTPYPHEDVAWIMENSGREMVLFSSDFPHVEGGRNPLKRFNDSLAGVDAGAKRAFYRDNFIDLMGKGLDPSLHDLPSLAAA